MDKKEALQQIKAGDISLEDVDKKLQGSFCEVLIGNHI